MRNSKKRLLAEYLLSTVKSMAIFMARIRASSETSSIVARFTIKLTQLCILDIDLKGAQKIHENFDPCNYLFIDVPSMSELEQRLRSRNTDKEEDIKKRLNNALEEVDTSKKLEYYHHIINDKFDQTMK
jgi:guanylate kinase